MGNNRVIGGDLEEARKVGEPCVWAYCIPGTPHV